MRDTAALHRLMAWLSPSFPVGAFSYSHGIEWAVEAGDITDLPSLLAWLDVVLRQGSGLADASLFRHAHAATRAQDRAALKAAAELAVALQPSRERRLEATAQGDAFLLAVRAAWPAPALDDLAAAWDGPCGYPVAVGVTAAAHGIPVDEALHAYLHAFSANLISAAVRLVPLGQTDGQRALAAIEPVIEAVATASAGLALDEIGGCALRSDIASMRHETQYTRLFRS